MTVDVEVSVLKYPKGRTGGMRYLGELLVNRHDHTFEGTLSKLTSIFVFSKGCKIVILFKFTRSVL